MFASLTHCIFINGILSAYAFDLYVHLQVSVNPALAPHLHLALEPTSTEYQHINSSHDSSSESSIQKADGSSIELQPPTASTGLTTSRVSINPETSEI